MGRKSSQPKTPEQQAYADRARRKAEFEERINAFALAEANRLREEEPNKYADLSLEPLNRAFIKGQKGISKAYLKIAEHMTWLSNVDKTQVSIIAQVQEKLPDLIIRPNIWNKKLSGRFKHKIIEKVKCNLSKPVDLRGCDTLAKIRKKVKMALRIASGALTFQPKIIVGGNTITIEKKSYSIVMRSVKGYSYPYIRVDVKNKRRCWVRADGLVAMLI